MSRASRESFRRRAEILDKRVEAKLAEIDLPSAASQLVIEATRNPFIWVTKYTKTRNEHWVEENRPEPYEHFPPYEYFQDIFDLIDARRVNFFEKSRDLMISWACVAYLTFHAMKIPSRGVLMQTQKEDKVIQLIEYAKCLYRTQPRWLQEAFPLTKPIENQPDLELRFRNGSYLAGIPGGADQIRSFHPWAYLNDESSFQPEAGESYNQALAVVSGKIIFNSSSGPGWYADVRHDVVRSEEE